MRPAELSDLLSKAEMCRRLAQTERSPAIAETLLDIAADYEERARRIAAMLEGLPHPRISPKAE